MQDMEDVGKCCDMQTPGPNRVRAPISSQQLWLPAPQDLNPTQTDKQGGALYTSCLTEEQLMPGFLSSSFLPSFLPFSPTQNIGSWDLVQVLILAVQALYLLNPQNNVLFYFNF